MRGSRPGTTVQWESLVDKVVIPMFLSPIIGLGLGYLLMVAILWLFRRGRPAKVNHGFRRAQIGSTAAMAFSHGTQDAQKTMGVITLALVTTGNLSGFDVPLWVILAAAGAMGLGTLAGGWRVIRTLGSRITALDPPKAFASQTAASSVLLDLRVRLQGPGVVDAHHDELDHGRRRDPTALGGALERRPAGRDRVGAHHPGCGDLRVRDVLRRQRDRRLSRRLRIP